MRNLLHNRIVKTRDLYYWSHAFTLIEALVAIFITSTSVIGLYGAMIQARKMVLDTRFNLEAQRIGLDRARSMSQMKYEDLRTFEDNSGTPGLLIEEITSSCYVAVTLPNSAKDYSSNLSSLSGEIWTQVYNYEDSCRITVSVRYKRSIYDEPEWIWRTYTIYRYDHGQQGETGR